MSEVGTERDGKIEIYDAGLELSSREERVKAVAEIWRVVKGDAIQDLEYLESALRRTYGDDVVTEGFERERPPKERSVSQEEVQSNGGEQNV